MIDLSDKKEGGALRFLLRLALFSFLLFSAASLFSAAGAYLYFARTTPEIPRFDSIKFGKSSTIAASLGETINEIYEERRYLLPYDRIPRMLIAAFLSSEDARFFEHTGIDLIGIARAIWSNIKAGEIKEGGSTITQQLARSMFTGREKTIARKIREAITARRIEELYTKEQILLLYMNLIYLGHGSYGVQAAALNYFRKDVSQLTLSEAAIIAALPQSPSLVNPVKDIERTKEKRDRILKRMFEGGHISKGDYEKALAEEIKAFPLRDTFGDKTPYFTEWAKEQLKEKTGGTAGDTQNAAEILKKAGFSCETTVDLGLSLEAEDALMEGLKRLDKKQGFRGAIKQIPAAEMEATLKKGKEVYLERYGSEILKKGGNYVAIVTAASKKEAEIRITPEIRGIVPLKMMEWAAPYLEGDNLSFEGKATDASKVLHPGDAVLVQYEGADKEGSNIFSLDQIPKVEGALMFVENASGYVVAAVGGADFDRNQVNRIFSLRQTGSAIKPVYYSKIYSLGVPPSTIFSGAPFRSGNYAPEGEESAKDMTLFEALTKSENNISLRVMNYLLNNVGVTALQDWGTRLGLSYRFAGYIAEGLGLDGTLYDLVRAYSVFALLGRAQDVVSVKKIEDVEGNVISDMRFFGDPSLGLFDTIEVMHKTVFREKAMVIDRGTAYITAMNLREVVKSGTAKRAAKFKVPVAGKTGTLPYDVWFAGFTPEYTGVVWIGSDRRERVLGKSRKNSQIYGANTALPVWLDFMEKVILAEKQSDPLSEPPEEIAIVQIDPATGLLAREKGMPIPHLKGTEPVEYTPMPDEPVFEKILITEF